MVNYNEFIKKEETRKKIALYLYSKQKIELQNISFVLPKRLFRYSGINKYFIDNLEKGTLTLSNPNLFNDLYDATLHNNSFQNHYNSEMERIELLQMLGISEKETISIEKLQAKAEHEDRFLSQYMKESLKVGCLSEDNSSILMWSHYADKNQGVCVEYDFSKTKLEAFMFPVIYVPTPVDCTDLCDTYLKTFDIDLAILLSAIVKYEIWKYEKEWRMILYYPAQMNTEERMRVQGLVPQPKAIYLGRNFLQYWINNKGKFEFSLFNRLCNYVRVNNIPLFVMKNKLMSYEIYPEMIDVDCVQRLNEDELYDKYLL